MENAQPEPSMEEILASIRKIISEDEEDQSASSTTETPDGGNEAGSSEVLTLTPAETAAEEATPQAETEPEETVATQTQETTAVMENIGEEEILDSATAEVASQAFRNLSQSVRVSEGPGRTLEDIVTEMLRPMVKEWLDANLPAIVEEKVEEEVQRVARRRR